MRITALSAIYVRLAHEIYQTSSPELGSSGRPQAAIGNLLNQEVALSGETLKDNAGLELRCRVAGVDAPGLEVLRRHTTK